MSIRMGNLATRALYAVVLLLLAGMLVFCVLYLSSAYETLKQWYLELNGCFYGVQQWHNNFFTPATKQAGNMYASIGAALSATGVYMLARRWKGRNDTYNEKKIPTKGLLWYAAVATLGICAALWQWRMMAPAYDELFSAVNCAELHPLQTWSYYMLPNNHVLFNLANNIFFGWHGHLVGTGRLLSMLAYMCTLLIAYHWLVKNLQSHLLAFFLVLPIAFQFAAWSMSAQARGYECQLLCGWVAFTSLLDIMNGNNGRLTRNTIANIAGFALVPSWFYFFAAQLLFAAGSMWASRKMLWQYCKHQAIVLAGTFLFYLPAICFSGIHALSGNKYVQAAPEKLSVFLSGLLYMSRHFICYCFSNDIEDGVVCYVLFALPLLLLFTKKHKQLAGFYLATWAAYLLCSLFIKHTPFHRTLIVQFSITMAFTVYTCWAVTEHIASLLRQAAVITAVRSIMLVIPIILLTLWEVRYDKQNVNFSIYSNDVNGLYGEHMETISHLPPSSSVAFSDESFYFFYHCRRLGYTVSRCSTGQEQYYVKRTDETLPALYRNYALLLQAEEDYEIYARK